MVQTLTMAQMCNLTDDEIDDLLSRLASEREWRWTLRRTPGLAEEIRSLLSPREPG